MSDLIWTGETPFPIPVNNSEAFEVLKGALFTLSFPQTLTNAQKRLISFILQRWIAKGYWLDHLILGKGDTKRPPFNLPGVQAEKPEAEYWAALLRLCIGLHDSSPFLGQHRADYPEPIHLWMGLAYESLVLDTYSVFQVRTPSKRKKLSSRRTLVKALDQEKRPTTEQLGGGVHWVNFFKAYVTLAHSRRRSPEFLKAKTEVIATLRSAIDHVEEDPNIHATYAKGRELFAGTKGHSTRVGNPKSKDGLRSAQLPKLPSSFWARHP